MSRRTIVGGDGERFVVRRRGRWQTVCTRGAYRALLSCVNEFAVTPDTRWRGPWKVSGYVPRALADGVHPRRLVCASGRSRNFTIRRQYR